MITIINQAIRIFFSYLFLCTSQTSALKPEQLRRELFKEYSINWKLVRHHYDFKELENTIADNFKEALTCPLCMRVFNAKALDQNSEIPLTLEHLPPEELGGKPLILLCKQCNSKTGHDLDVKLLEYLKVKPFNTRQANSSIKLKNTTLKSNSVDIKGTAILKRLNENMFSLNMDLQDEYRLERMKLIDYENELQIIYKPHSNPSIDQIHIGLLKIGYLSAFYKFGHSFILNPNYDLVRSQILNPERPILPSKGVLTNTSINPGFYLITDPARLRSIFAVFEIKHNNTTERNGVLINPPYMPALDFYLRLKEYEGKPFQVRFDRFLHLDYHHSKMSILKFWRTFEPPYFKLDRLGF